MTEELDNWKIRRRIILTTLLFCAFTILYIMFTDMSSVVAQSIVMGSFGLAGSVIAAYCFAAVWDDQSKFKYDIQKNGKKQ